MMSRPVFKSVIDISDHVIKDIQAEANIRIDGKLTGNITVCLGSDVWIAISRTGMVNGNISGGTILIAGRVDGDVTTTRHVEMHAGGLIRGELICPDPIIEPGALVLCFRK